MTSQNWEPVHHFPQDGSPRDYTRVRRGDVTAILMDCGPDEKAISGHRLHDFIRIGAWLRSVGLRAPEIYEVDEAAGWALIEDFGDISLKKAAEQGGDEMALYSKAHEILRHLSAQKELPDLPVYKDGAEYKTQRQLVEWYVPEVTGRALSAAEVNALEAGYWDAWAEIESGLPPCPQGFVHADYHAENLLVLDNGEIGIIDFQAAKKGPAPYDLGNLLEDMRRNVSPDVRAALLKDYDEACLVWYRIVTTQFHCRLLGQCIRWRDRDNKPGYMVHVPRLESYVREALNDPLLTPLRAWFECTGLPLQT